eukprot:Clim_evm44s236 gene=Clim_evmTU44s236
MTKETVLVLGGSGIVGSGIVKALLEDGYRVIAPVRSETARDRLQHDISHISGDIEIMTGYSTQTEEDGKKLADALSGLDGDLGTFHHVTCSLGAFWSGQTLSESTGAELDTVFRSRAFPHFYGWRYLMSLLSKPPSGNESMYLFITGALSESCPDPKLSLFHVASASVGAILRAARVEADADRATGKHNVGVGEIRICNWVVRPSDYDESGTHFQNDTIGAVAVKMIKNKLSKNKAPLARLETREQAAAFVHSD